MTNYKAKFESVRLVPTGLIHIIKGDVCVCVCVCVTLSVVSDPLQPHRL